MYDFHYNFMLKKFKRENIDLLFKIFDLYKLFDITPENIFSVPVPLHATLFYKIIKNNKYYIYYSNSGFGSENHIIGQIETHETIVPKIYDVGTPENQIKIIL